MNAANLLAVAQGVYAFNRFLGSAIMMSPKVKPRWMLGGYLGCCFIFALAATLTHGHTSVALLILVLCFESVRPKPLRHFHPFNFTLLPTTPPC
jgi:FHS family L-fucose permease-like MFS transporter